jgi:hypothetical protein
VPQTPPNFHLYITAIAAVCSIFSMLGNLIAVVIMLYVRSEVKPIATEVRMLTSGQTEIKTTQNNIWKELGGIGQRVSFLEGQGELDKEGLRKGA